MSNDTEALTVIDNAEKKRFEARIDDDVAFLTYRKAGGQITLLHAETPPRFRGRGVAAQVTKFALDAAREQGLRVVPLCPYVSAYFRRYPQYADLVQKRDRQAPTS